MANIKGIKVWLQNQNSENVFSRDGKHLLYNIKIFYCDDHLCQKQT